MDKPASLPRHEPGRLEPFLAISLALHALVGLLWPSGWEAPRVHLSMAQGGVVQVIPVPLPPTSPPVGAVARQGPARAVVALREGGSFVDRPAGSGERAPAPGAPTREAVPPRRSPSGALQKGPTSVQGAARAQGVSEGGPAASAAAAKPPAKDQPGEPAAESSPGPPPREKRLTSPKGPVAMAAAPEPAAGEGGGPGRAPGAGQGPGRVPGQGATAGSGPASDARAAGAGEEVGAGTGSASTQAAFGPGPGAVAGPGPGGGHGPGEGSSGPRVPEPVPASAVWPQGELQPPSYPKDAVNRQLEGRVVLRLTVGADGRVQQAEVLESSGRPDIDGVARLWAQRQLLRPSPTGAGYRLALELVFSVLRDAQGRVEPTVAVRPLGQLEFLGAPQPSSNV